MALNLRNVEISRPHGLYTPHGPHTKKMPEALLCAAGANEHQVKQWMSTEIVRIARLDGDLLGMYALQRGDGLTYLLHGVMVTPQWRKQGLGRWLVGHAIGVAESKGGRRVLFAANIAPRFFGHIGFVADQCGQRFDLIQE